MFELFNVPGFYIAVQEVLALAVSWTSQQVGECMLMSIVIDKRDGVTHVLPVVEGYVIGSCIKHILIVGDIAYFMQQLLREREVGIPLEQSLETTEAMKEKYYYICPDIVKEFAKYDVDPGSGSNSTQMLVTKGSCNLKYFFYPEFANPDVMESILNIVDEYKTVPLTCILLYAHSFFSHSLSSYFPSFPPPFHLSFFVDK
uniref:Actin-related protein 3 n=1 Tax=Piliocolobus tephrosceles TaxID=591936 RepID=A0A8C9J0R5_9PRIM